MVDVLSGVLSGANFGPFVPPVATYLPRNEKQVGLGTGHFFGAMRIDGFMSEDEFKSRMDDFIHEFRSAKTVEGEEKVLVPGDIEREAEARLMKEGIYIVPGVIDDFKEVARELGVDFE